MWENQAKNGKAFTEHSEANEKEAKKEKWHKNWTYFFFAPNISSAVLSRWYYMCAHCSHCNRMKNSRWIERWQERKKGKTKWKTWIKFAWKKKMSTLCQLWFNVNY